MLKVGRHPLVLPYVESGSRLAPMHRLHDPMVPCLPLCRSGRG